MMIRVIKTCDFFEERRKLLEIYSENLLIVPYILRKLEVFSTSERSHSSMRGVIYGG